MVAAIFFWMLRRKKPRWNHFLFAVEFYRKREIKEIKEVILSCSKVYLRNENLSIYSIHSTKYVMHVGSIVDVTTLGLNHSLYSSRHAFIQWFEVRWCALLQAFESYSFETRSQPSFFLTLQLFCFQPQWLNQIDTRRIFRPSWEEFDTVLGVLC